MKFEQLLREIFEDDTISSYKLSNPTVYAKLIRNFETAKYSSTQAIDLIHEITKANEHSGARERLGFLDQVREFWLLQRLNKTKIKALPLRKI